jgi:hypothetical protein
MRDDWRQLSVLDTDRMLTRVSHHVWTLLGAAGRAGLQPRRNRGSRPLLVPCPAQSRKRGTARGAGHKNNQEGLVTAGLKPRPSRPMARNAG